MAKSNVNEDRLQERFVEADRLNYVSSELSSVKDKLFRVYKQMSAHGDFDDKDERTQFLDELKDVLRDILGFTPQK